MSEEQDLRQGEARRPGDEPEPAERAEQHDQDAEPTLTAEKVEQDAERDQAEG